MLRGTYLSLCCVLIVCWSSLAAGQDQPMKLPEIDRSANVIAGIRLRPDRVDIRHVLQQLEEARPGLGKYAQTFVRRFEGTLATLKAADVKDMMVLLTLSGLPDDPILLVLPGNQTGNGRILAAVASSYGGSEWEVAFHRGVTLIGSQANLDRVRVPVDEPHEELIDALAADANADFQLLLTPSPDHRRVVRELLPKLPGDLGGGESKVLVDGAQWVSIGYQASETEEFRLVVQSVDEASAEKLHGWLGEHGVIALAQALGLSTADERNVLESMLPEVSGPRLTRSYGLAEPGAKLWLALLSKPAEAGIQAVTARNAETNLKQIMLAMHNHHDATGSFPGYGSASEQGEALLSWRVLLLPYLGEAELYNEFHRDEPWNSPHNVKLIGKMPRVYLGLGSEHDLNQGLSNYRVPGGPTSVFPDTKGVQFKDITDGSSNTIGVLEVDDEHAAIWTKPETFEIDKENPTKGLGCSLPDFWFFARCDGSTDKASKDIDLEKLKALISKAGGEVIERD